MPRYIDADDFYKRLSNPPYTIYNGEMFAEWFEECFKTQPTADVEPVRHGHWIITDDGWWLTCPFCGASVDLCHRITILYDDHLSAIPHFNFCPNCGAKMDKE